MCNLLYEQCFLTGIGTMNECDSIPSETVKSISLPKISFISFLLFHEWLLIGQGIILIYLSTVKLHEN